VASRRLAREHALQVLFQLDMTGDELNTSLDLHWRGREVDEPTRAFAERVVRGAVGDAVRIDGLITEASENWAAFSPDGRWVAFSSTAESDIPEVYVARFPTPGQLWRISADGGTQARWRHDGKEIFYLSPERRLMSAKLTLGNDSLKVDRIEPLFTLQFPYGAYHAFDVTRDGERFLVNTSVASAGARQQANLKVRLYEEGHQ